MCPKPVSSRTMNSTFGAPSRARLGSGHAGLDTSKVRPITPENAWPGLYSLSVACACEGAGRPVPTADAATSAVLPSRSFRRLTVTWAFMASSRFGLKVVFGGADTDREADSVSLAVNWIHLV